MNIRGQFKDINNNNIEVWFNNTAKKGKDITIGENDLFFSGNPIEIETNNDDTFEHIIQKSLTVNLITKNYVGDYFFAENSHTVPIQIYKNNKLIFSGYVEPSTFSQPFSLPLEEFSINCTDYLSTLQYIKYNNATLDTFDELKTQCVNKSFLNILKEAFIDATDSKIWYDCSKGVNNEGTRTVFSDLGINENYLYGEEFDDIMSYEDIVKEIMQYLNLHIIQEGNDFYIFDWENIRYKNTQWINILELTESKTTSPQLVNITNEKHADTDTNITIADVYNQIQVTCELEDQETIIESPLDTDFLKSNYRSKFHYMTEYQCDKEEEFVKIINGGISSDKSVKIKEWFMQPLYSKNWKLLESQATEYDNNNYPINAYKELDYLHNNPITPLLVNFGSGEAKNYRDNSPIGYIDTKPYLYISINGNGKNSEEKSTPTEDTIQARQPIIEYVGTNGGGIFSPNDEVTTNYLVFKGKISLQPNRWESDRWQSLIDRTPSNEDFTTGEMKAGLYKFEKVKVTQDKEAYYTRKFFQNIYPKEDVVYNGIMVQPPTNEMGFKFESDGKHDKEAFKYQYTTNVCNADRYKKLPILECELIIGNKRLVEYSTDKDGDVWGNSAFMWCDVDSGIEESYIDDDGETKTYLKQTFTIGVDPKFDEYIIGNEFDIQNTVEDEYNINVKGMAIPIKQSDNLSGAVIFRVLGPVNLMWYYLVKRHPTFWRHTKWYDKHVLVLPQVENIILSEFECKIYTDGGGLIQYEDNDLIYMSNENHKYYNTKDDITFKFITQLTSEECAEKGITPSVCLNSVVNTSTMTPINNIYNDITKETAKAEEHYVNQYYNEYSSPKIIMETTLHDGEDISFGNLYHSSGINKDFYIQGIKQNIKYNTATITIKEL